MSNNDRLDDLADALEELLQPAAKVVDKEKRKNEDIITTTIKAPVRAGKSLFRAVTFGIFDD